MSKVTIRHGSVVRIVSDSEWQEVLDDMVRTLGPWDPATCSVTRQDVPDLPPPVPASTSPVPASAPPALTSTPPALTSTSPAPAPAPNPDDAAARIGRIKESLAAAGVDMSTAHDGAGGEQFYADGTPLAAVGYKTQATRAREHAEKQLISDAARALVDQIQAERRQDVEMSAGDFGRLLAINGRLTVDHLVVREQALRGLIARFHSPALSYVLGLRERIADAAATMRKPEQDDAVRRTLAAGIEQDKAALLDVLQRECRRHADVQLKLRTRGALGDVFAVVSPTYAAADAPDVLRDVLAELPSDARGTFSYDPVTTAWELRAAVFTPTPADEQAVGEPFEGYLSVLSRDNGTHGLDFGGGILIIRCLNASTYTAASRAVRRRHVGAILVDLAHMVQGAAKSIHALCAAWGQARTATLEPLVPIEEAIPGFYRHMLTARKGSLLGVLPGRTERHVEALTRAYTEERRDAQNITRADLAQGFTRYIQTQPADVRRNAERAIGRWMVKAEPVVYAAA